MLSPEAVSYCASMASLLEAAEDELVQILRGRFGGLRTSKPGEGEKDLWKRDFLFYFWRMARFHSGDDPRLPLTADLDLTEAVEHFMEDHKVPLFSHEYLAKRAEEGKKPLLEYQDLPSEFLRRIDGILDRVLVRLGKNPAKGSRMWSLPFKR